MTDKVNLPNHLRYQGHLYRRVASLAERMRWFPAESLHGLLSTLVAWPPRRQATVLWHDGEQSYLLIDGTADEEAVARELAGGDQQKFERTLRHLRPVSFREVESKGRREHLNTINWNLVQRFFSKDAPTNV